MSRVRPIPPDMERDDLRALQERKVLHFEIRRRP